MHILSKLCIYPISKGKLTGPQRSPGFLFALVSSGFCNKSSIACSHTLQIF